MPSKFSSAFKSVRQAVDLPLPLGPTIINPWWIWDIWYSWRIYNTEKAKKYTINDYSSHNISVIYSVTKE